MRKGIYQYPFQGKMMTATEISRYYRRKEIDLSYAIFSTELRKMAEEIGRENITEEQVIATVKDVISRKSLGTALPGYEENCIKEFGQEFWNEVLTKKAKKAQEIQNKKINTRKFRESMKAESNQMSKVKTPKKNIIEREVKDGGAR